MDRAACRATVHVVTTTQRAPMCYTFFQMYYDLLIQINNERFHFWGAPQSLQMVTEAMKLKDACSLEEKL